MWDMNEERHAGGADLRLRAVRFGAFELDVRAGELKKRGLKIRLQEQPFQVLLMLLERPGEVVLREEIRKKLWPNDTIVEFAPSINAAIQRLREALGDSADKPRYVETVARRGYRLLEKVTSDRSDLQRLKGETNSTLSASLVPAASTEPGKAFNSIAVLPFANAGRNPDGDYLSEGITESIINSLSRIAQLRVTPRSTVFRYKGQDMDPQAIGRELSVRVVLTGRVTQRGETLVVGAELVDVAEGSQLWGERYNRKLADIFDVEEEIAKKISESLRMKLNGDEEKRLTRRFTENSEAYQLYLRGRHYWAKRTPDSMKKGFRYFQQAIEKDPGYALAYSGLADCYSQLAAHGLLPPKEGWSRAKAAAAAAVALDPDLAEAHTSLAFVRAFADWDWLAAEREFQRAIELDPAYWVAPYWYGVILTACGRFEAAGRLTLQAQALEPLSPVIAHGAAYNFIASRRYADAIDVCLKAIDIDPNYPLLRMWLGLAYEQESRYKEAITECEKALQLFGREPVVVGPLAHVHAMAGHHAKALRMLHGLLALAKGRHVDAYAVAITYAALGQKDLVMEWLETACNNRAGWFTYQVKSDPRLDWLRQDPRFEKVLRRMGLA